MSTETSINGGKPSDPVLPGGHNPSFILSVSCRRRRGGLLPSNKCCRRRHHRIHVLGAREDRSICWGSRCEWSRRPLTTILGGERAGLTAILVTHRTPNGRLIREG
ncbi:hypothetical protein SUGI_1228580 [Cryptomeria japonica]|uniref:Uncharacterized protein n=1 Tax=Cryptomeria japonica TaxID=3369 RepID=A0AAD3NRZ7_CRYJA|nr:hypothetical protein SUGI_1228580 [Cryptomeria japonica]